MTFDPGINDARTSTIVDRVPRVYIYMLMNAG